MTAVVAVTGRAVALQYLIGELTTTEKLRMKLFTNDVTPTEDSIIGDFIEATFTGYASVLLETWTRTDAEAEHARVEFTSTADQTAQSIYGYLIVRGTSNELIAAKRFTGAPYSMEFAGDVIGVTPTLQQGAV